MTADDARQLVAELGIGEHVAAVAATAPPLPAATRDLWTSAIHTNATAPTTH